MRCATELSECSEELGRSAAAALSECPCCHQSLVQPGMTRSGAGWTMWLGRSEEIIPTLGRGAIAACITDGPYGSGGDTRKARTQETSKKYSNTGSSYAREFPDFAGDSLQPEAWVATQKRVWAAVANALPRDSGASAAFIDWRQVPFLWQILSASGLRVRGTIPWDKGPSARPCRGGFRSQAEYVLWGSAGGAMPRADIYLPGVLAHTTLTNQKWHPTAKPIGICRTLVQCAPPGSVILDPFAGAASIGVAALLEGYQFIGIEQEPHYFLQACKRLTQAVELINAGKVPSDRKPIARPADAADPSTDPE